MIDQNETLQEHMLRSAFERMEETANEILESQERIRGHCYNIQEALNKRRER